VLQRFSRGDFLRSLDDLIDERTLVFAPVVNNDICAERLDVICIFRTGDGYDFEAADSRELDGEDADCA
jgi:hypothetical protein